VQFLFGDHVLDVERRELRRGSEPVAVGPQVFDLLVYLLQNRDRMVSKDDLITSVWGGRIVSESTLTSRINAARTAIGDSGEEQRFIKTLPRKGFRFVGEVRERSKPAATGATDRTAMERQDHPMAPTGVDPDIYERPSVVVLPFANLSGDPAQEYFADGLSENITTAFSLWHSFPVIARGSAFVYKGQTPDIRQVGKDLGTRYVVEGSVRRAGNRVRISAQLIDTETGHQVWADRYDRELTDIFALQDEIAARIAAVIEPAIANSERKRISTKPPNDLNAWDLCVQGYSLIYQGTKEGNKQAQELYERAIALDRDYARAWTWLAYTHARDISLWQTGDPDTAAQKVMEFARQAVCLDNTDSEAHLMPGRAFNLAAQSVNALAETRRAIELNPQNSTACWSHGFFLYVSGRPAEGIPWLEKALDINPLDPRNYVFMGHLAGAKLCSGDCKSAVELASDSIRQRPDYFDSRVTLAAALGHLGRADEARHALGEFRNRAQDYVEEHPFPLWRRNVKDHYLAGL
jgi:TolB-like protein